LLAIGQYVIYIYISLFFLGRPVLQVKIIYFLLKVYSLLTNIRASPTSTPIPPLLPLSLILDKRSILITIIVEKVGLSRFIKDQLFILS
jgi:hypothetical protein